MTTETKVKIYGFAKTTAIVLFYALQLLFVLIYSEPDVQPFVYVRF